VFFGYSFELTCLISETLHFSPREARGFQVMHQRAVSWCNGIVKDRAINQHRFHAVVNLREKIAKSLELALNRIVERHHWTQGASDHEAPSNTSRQSGSTRVLVILQFFSQIHDGMASDAD